MYVDVGVLRRPFLHHQKRSLPVDACGCAIDPTECRCDCHRFKGMMHCMPCCEPCSECGKNIAIGGMEIHRKQHRDEEHEQHLLGLA